jgi:type IV secretory pathway VirB2 component (pilin)
MDELNILLLKGYKINWKRELKWVFVVIAILLAAFFRIDIINLLKLLF